MTRDVTKLNFYSGDPIDKIVATGTVTYTNDGNTTSSGTNIGYQSAKIQTDTISNLYNKRVLCRYIWSIDGTNFNSSESRITFSYTITFTDIPTTSPSQIGLRAAVSVGVSDNTIYFLTANGYHGNVSTLSSSPSTIGYTPISQTFTIKYALFEIQ